MKKKLNENEKNKNQNLTENINLGVFDLENIEKYNFNKNVNNNLKKINKLYGDTFLLKSELLKEPIKVFLVKEQSIINNNVIFELKYKVDYTYGFVIKFIDIILNIVNNNSYIKEINNLKNFNGSLLIQLVNEINKKLNVVKSYIYDATHIECNEYDYNLSFFKLIENNRTFYMKYGFKFANIRYFRYTTDSYLFFINDEHKQNNYINNLINKCKKIKIKYINNKFNKLLNILLKVIKKNDYNNLKITKYNISDFYKNTNDKNINIDLNKFIDIKDSLINIIKYITDFLALFDSFKNEKIIYFYELMIKLFNDKQLCGKYVIINNMLDNDFIYKIEYNNYEYIDNIFKYFYLLSLYKNNYYYIIY